MNANRYHGMFAVVLVLVLGAGQVFAEEPAGYDSGGRRDPFVPLISASGAAKSGTKAGTLQFQGIIIDARKGASALINGQLYQKGDRVDNTDVVDVFADRVVVKQGNEEKTIWFYENPTGQGDPENGKAES